MIPQTCTVPAGDYESYVDFREEITRAWAFFEPLDEEGLTVMHFVRSLYAPVEGGTFLIDGINYNVAASFPVYEHESEIEADEAAGTMAVMISPEEVILSTDPLDVAMVENVNRYGIMPTSARYENIETYANTSIVPWQINSDMNNKCKEVIFHDVVRPLTVATWFRHFKLCERFTNMAKYLDTSKVTSISSMFKMYTGTIPAMQNRTIIVDCDTSAFNLDNVTDASYFLEHARFASFNFEHIFEDNHFTNMACFTAGVGFGELPESWTNQETGYCKPVINTSSAVNVSSLFHGWNIKKLDISHLLLEKATNINSLVSTTSGGFNNIMTDVKLPTNINTDGITSLRNLFYGNDSLQNIEGLELWEFSNELDSIENMFAYCRNLVNVDLSNFTLSPNCYASNAFENCNALSTIIVKSGTDISARNTNLQVFKNCYKLVGGNGTRWTDLDWKKQDLGKYAKVDGGPDAPGFFTAK